MTISDQLATHGATTAATRHPEHHSPPTTATDKHTHTFHTQGTLEDVLGEKREQRRSVSQLVADEYRQPFTLSGEGGVKIGATEAASAAPTPADVARGIRPLVERERRNSQQNAAKGFLHANPTGVAGVSADVATYAQASTVGAGGHSTPKLPEGGDHVFKKAAAHSGATMRARTASMEAADVAKAREAKLMLEAEKNLALHAEIEAAK